jgi:hypothetical protein
MLAQSGNVCVRCGKRRIVTKTWTERVGGSLVKYTDTACPDLKCQKMVEKDNKDRKKKREILEKQRAQSKQARVNLTLSKKHHAVK